jgi:hypothetical protein
MRSNVELGVRSSSHAPIPAPASDGMISSSSQRRAVASSRRKPYAEASDPGHIATAFVAFARIGSRPIHTSAGNEINVPPPAMELIAPASKAAVRMIAVSSTRGMVSLSAPQRFGVRRLAAALGRVQRSGFCHATQSGGKPRALQSAAARRGVTP